MAETIKGFSDYTGEEARKRQIIKEILVEEFEKYGFEPAETPIIENRDFVIGDNSEDEAISDVFKLEDKGKRKLALRYELTFPLKRISKNKKLPYKRYSIGSVFRDEPVGGNRVRQITQADIDIISSGTREEAEILSIAKKILDRLRIKAKIIFNNRKLLNEILEKTNINLEDREQAIREIDKLDKLPEIEVRNNLRKLGLDADKLLEIIKKPLSYFVKYKSYNEIKELVDYCKLYNLEIEFSASLARGLSYYTGSIFEIKGEMKETICAGGSYLVNSISSTGISFGIERLAKITKIPIENNVVLIISLNQDKKAISLAEKLRGEGKNIRISFDKLTKGLDLANSLEIKKVIIIGEDEVKKKKYKLKDMDSGKEKMLGEKELVNLF